MTAALKFVLGGALATAVHGVMLSVLVEGLAIDPVAANVPAFGIAFAVSYLFHHRVTFGSELPHRQALLRYLSVALAGLGTNTLVLAAAVHLTALHYLIGFVLATVAAAVQTFVLSKRWAFEAGR